MFHFDRIATAAAAAVVYASLPDNSDTDGHQKTPMLLK